MRVFLDTNVILEYYCARKQYAFAEQIFESADYGQHEYHISLGSFYTITYILEDEFRQRGIHRPELTDELREVLESILDIFRVSSVNEKQLLAAVRDQNFADLAIFELTPVMSFMTQRFLLFRFKAPSFTALPDTRR